MPSLAVNFYVFLLSTKAGALNRKRVLDVLVSYYDSSTKDVRRSLMDPQKCNAQLIFFLSAGTVMLHSFL